MICEIINPSDPYTITGESFPVLAAATLMLGEGKYGLRGDGHEMPLFLFGGHEEWCAANGIGDLSAFFDAHLVEMADALDTVAIPGGKNRSSLNNIGKSAQEIAKMLRRAAAKKATATV